MQLAGATARDMTAIDIVDLKRLAEHLRIVVSADSAKRIHEVNSYLTRKITGARHALQYSEDGVSQAANSIIELIDRLLRESFDREFVRGWVDANLPDDRTLTYELESGVRLPTKRAEALCAVYSGAPIARTPVEGDDGSGPTLVHDVLARVIVAAREKLQRLKHSDRDDEEDRQSLLSIMVSLEGALMLALKLGWAPGPAQNETVRKAG